MILRRQRARVMSSPLATWHCLASALVRPRMVANRFDHLAIVEPESVGESVGRSGPIVHLPVTLG
jgi:hypothetical protein